MEHEGESEVARAMPDWPGRLTERGEGGQTARAAGTRSPTEELVLQLEAHVVVEKMAGAGRVHSRAVERQGHTVHRLGSPHIHVCIAMLEGIEQVGGGTL